MLLEAFGWRCLLKIWRFPLRFDALEAFGWRFLLKIWRFPLRFDAFGGFLDGDFY